MSTIIIITTPPRRQAELAGKSDPLVEQLEAVVDKLRAAGYDVEVQKT